jgi:hypothetical protein
MYYPKSQIKPNLYTNGGEYALFNTKQSYKGYYYETSNQKKYTGKHPGDGENILLEPISEELQDSRNPPNPLNQPQNSTYIEIDFTSIDYPNPNPPQSRFIPSYISTIPTSQDISNGIYIRYFCKKNNELKYIEISKENYELLKNKSTNIAWDLYDPISIPWVIKGDEEKVFSTNKTQINIIENKNKWYGFSQYLKNDYLKNYIK